jgi:hypothetical protein
MCRCLCGILTYIPLGITLGVVLLVHTAVLFLVRQNTNTSNTMKNMLHLEVINRSERVKEVKKVNVVDVLSVQEEYRIFKPIEITIRRGLR